jgi:hypothetical protein
MKLVFGKAAVAHHALEFRSRISVSGWSLSEHDQRKGCGHWWADTIVIGHKFQRGNAAAGFKSGI